MHEAEGISGSALEFCDIYVRKKIHSFVIADYSSSVCLYFVVAFSFDAW